MTALPDPTERAWIGLARSYRSVVDRVAAALKAAGLPPLEWYDALLEIERAGPAGIRPFELQPRLLLPQYGLSRLLERLEKRQLIEKRRCEGDRRGFHVRITALGRQTRARMWPVYAGALEASLGRDLSAEQLRLFGEIADVKSAAVPRRG